jgi:REP element-mobilizing transposase RayT
MSNKRRRREPDLTYHIFSRCINKLLLMKKDRMKDLMILVLNMALEKYDFKLCNYVIMDNHFHLIIKTVNGGADISRIMQFIKSQYARRYNILMKRTGPFWNERYGDRIIEESENPQKTLFNLIHYINNNPSNAHYLNDTKKYKYGCMKYFLDENYDPPVKLLYHDYFLELGDSFKERVNKLMKFEESSKRQVFKFSFQV